MGHIPYIKRKDAQMSDLIGLTFTSVVKSDEGDSITFNTSEGRTFVMYHEQDCCEFVWIEDIAGDLNDLVGEPILMSEEVSSEGALKKEEWHESFTWTFYKMASRKGYVDIRWYSTSNGYYSESVDLVEVIA